MRVNFESIGDCAGLASLEVRQCEASCAHTSSVQGDVDGRRAPQNAVVVLAGPESALACPEISVREVEGHSAEVA